jgi:hypothetical protein
MQGTVVYAQLCMGLPSMYPGICVSTHCLLSHQSKMGLGVSPVGTSLLQLHSCGCFLAAVPGAGRQAGRRLCRASELEA